MSNLKSERKSCRDVFNAFLVSLAYYAGIFEFPVIQPTYWIPNRLIAFSKSISSKDFNQWVHFYENDWLFERIWRNPKRYLEILQKFNGVILPDFSLYRDMPFAMQIWNIYRSRAIGCWLQRNGVPVIANVRYADRRTFRCCCDGLSRHCVIAVGSHGLLKSQEDRRNFLKGLDAVVRRLEPSAIVVYGKAPDVFFNKYRQMGVQIIQFESECSISHEAVK